MVDLSKFSSGVNTSFSSELNKNTEFVLGNIITMMDAIAPTTELLYGRAQFLADTSTTDAMLVGGMYRPKGMLYDSYDNNSFDLGLHTVTFAANFLNSSSITEDTTKARIYIDGDGGAAPNDLRATVLFNHDFTTSTSGIIFNANMAMTCSDAGSATGTKTVSLTYGGVTLRQVTSSSIAAMTKKLYVVINAAKTLADVYYDGALDTAGISLAGKTDEYFRAVATAERGSGTGFADGLKIAIELFEVRYSGAGMTTTTDTVYFADTVSLPSTATLGFVKLTDTTSGGTSRVIGLSVNNGSTYSTTSDQTLTTITGTPSTPRVRLQYTYGDGGSFTVTKLGGIFG